MVTVTAGDDVLEAGAVGTGEEELDEGVGASLRASAACSGVVHVGVLAGVLAGRGRFRRVVLGDDGVDPGVRVQRREFGEPVLDGLSGEGGQVGGEVAHAVLGRRDADVALLSLGGVAVRGAGAEQSIEHAGAGALDGPGGAPRRGVEKGRAQVLTAGPALELGVHDGLVVRGQIHRVVAVQRGIDAFRFDLAAEIDHGLGVRGADAAGGQGLEDVGSVAAGDAGAFYVAAGRLQGAVAGDGHVLGGDLQARALAEPAGPHGDLHAVGDGGEPLEVGGNLTFGLGLEAGDGRVSAGGGEALQILGKRQQGRGVELLDHGCERVDSVPVLAFGRCGRLPGAGVSRGDGDGEQVLPRTAPAQIRTNIGGSRHGLFPMLVRFLRMLHATIIEETFDAGKI